MHLLLYFSSRSFGRTFIHLDAFSTDTTVDAEEERLCGHHRPQAGGGPPGGRGEEKEVPALSAMQQGRGKEAGLVPV